MRVKAVGYTRLSQESDTSIGSQKEDIEKYCENCGFELERIFDDGQNSSGFDDERPQYVEMKDRLEKGDIGAVVIRDRTRLGRDFDERMKFILDLREEEVELHTWTDGQIDLEDPYSVAVEGIHSASDDKKKREEIRKAQHELQKRKDKGCFQGNPPFGLKFGPDNCFLVPDEEFEKALEVIRKREKEGMSYPEIADGVDGMTQSKAWRICEKNREMYVEKKDEFLD